MRVRLVLYEQQPADLVELMVEDGVRFQETPAAQPGDRPMLITGDRIHAIDPNRPQAVITVVGRLAHFEGHGMTLDGPNINVDRGAPRLWVEGPGQMLLPVARDLEGHPLPRPGELSIGWHKGMTFDGLIARFASDYPQSVSVLGRQGQLRTGILEVHLKQAIRFGEGNLQGPGQGQAELSKLFCRGGADLDNATFDPAGRLRAAAANRRSIARYGLRRWIRRAGLAEPGGAGLIRFDANDGHARRDTPGTSAHRP